MTTFDKSLCLSVVVEAETFMIYNDKLDGRNKILLMSNDVCSNCSRTCFILNFVKTSYDSLLAFYYSNALSSWSKLLSTTYLCSCPSAAEWCRSKPCSSSQQTLPPEFWMHFGLTFFTSNLNSPATPTKHDWKYSQFIQTFCLPFCHFSNTDNVASVNRSK